MYRGGAEQKIRKYLVDNNYVDAVIQLSGGLFFGTSIATCIMVLKKGKSDNWVMFIDASKECIKVTNNNKLTPEILTASLMFLPNVRMLLISAIWRTMRKFSRRFQSFLFSTYVEPEDTREKIDIEKLNTEIAEIVAREQVLRSEIDKIIAEIEW